MNTWWSLLPELSPLLTLILVVVLVALASLLAWRRRQRAAKPLTHQTFERGFDLLLEARWQEAAEVLKTAVKTDPNRTLEYLALGKLVRRRGEPARAARMFEQLRARPGLDRAMGLTAQYELALCYHTLGWYEPAVATLEQLLGADPTHAEARRELRRIHEDMGRWEAAAALELLRLKRGEAQDRRTLAALLTQQGKSAWAAGNARHSGAHLRSALALDPDCVEAALYLGRILLRQRKLSKAFDIWDKLAKARPDLLFLAFRDMQAAFRHLHNEAGWESFLRTFTQRHPSDPTGYLALAEWYEARGQIDEAMRCLRQVLELDPLCREAHLALLALYRGQGIPSEALDSYAQLARRPPQLPGGRFRCRACGHAGEELFWRCPACHGWDAPERLMLPPSTISIVGGDFTPPLSDSHTSVSAPIAVTYGAPVQPTSGA
ncbi:MAG TPA: tetratricopeptide repeat protein [Candidatus Tectomicrobia bacterium]|nr:tetratricopeptide repeat protein [Candidatus Tectomicrobia bacterium]